MEQAFPSISPADLYARLGTATAPTVVDVRRPADFADAGELIVSAFHRDPDAVEQLRWWTGGWASHPTVYVNGEVLVEPSISELNGALMRSGWR